MRARYGIPITLALLLLLATTAGCGKQGEEYSHQVLHAIDQGKLVGTKGDMQALARALSAYSVDRGGYPVGASIQEATNALSPAFLVVPISVDAWGHPFAYTSDGKSYTLTAPGADGRVGSADDVVMVDGSFTQVPAAGPS
ncbi:MAG TPA: type II secretion system protein GspG [Candidatus Polarisedimenticolia bacterium]|nr:type II secretion system protein GspG [Candidatus Polarisedimenticolia bacterium]